MQRRFVTSVCNSHLQRPFVTGVCNDHLHRAFVTGIRESGKYLAIPGIRPVWAVRFFTQTRTDSRRFDTKTPPVDPKIHVDLSGLLR